MPVVALTGGIGSGKSAVANLLAQRGAVIVDFDVLAREAVEPGTPAFTEIVERFGPNVVAADGSLNRRALGEVVFADERALRDLEAITHPAIRELAELRTRTAGPVDVVVHVIPLLAETGQNDRFDAVIVVDVDPASQLDRVRRRDGFSTGQAQARIDAQAHRADRLAIADYVVDNSGTPDELVAKVTALWDKLTATRHVM